MMQCERCGAEFDVKQATQRFCSVRCRRAGERARARARGYKPPPRYAFICKHCGRDYQTAYKGRDTYCSRECMITNNLALGRQAKLKIACVHCGARLLAADAYSSTCCSKECHEQHYRYECVVCGKVSIGTVLGRVTCSGECREELNRRQARDSSKKQFDGQVTPKKCKECGCVFVPEYGSKRRAFCSRECASKYNEKQKPKNHQQRAKRYGVKYEWFSDMVILKRDGWRCYICGCSTPRELRGTYEDNAPEIDHIVPLSRGGAHTKDNVRCCCRACNIAKTNMTLKEMRQARVNQAVQVALL